MTDISPVSVGSTVSIDMLKKSEDIAQSQVAQLLSGLASPGTSSGGSDSAKFSANAMAMLDNQG